MSVPRWYMDVTMTVWIQKEAIDAPVKLGIPYSLMERHVWLKVVLILVYCYSFIICLLLKGGREITRERGGWERDRERGESQREVEGESGLNDAACIVYCYS